MSSIVLPTPHPVIVPPWIPIGLGEIGVIEDARSGQTHPRIPEYHSVTRAGRALDDIAWCSSYVGCCLELAGIRSTRNKTAASYKTWDMDCLPRLLSADPSAWLSVFGAVAFFGPKDPDSASSGHVGFLLGRSAGDLFVLGGNQDNRVSIALRRMTSLQALRWPTAFALPRLAPLVA